MDALRDERGQAAILAVLLLAIGAVTIAGLRLAQERILVQANEQWAGEAAVEAAAAVFSDAYVAHLESLRARAHETPAPTPNVPAVLANPATAEAARAAAAQVAGRNGAELAGAVSARCDGRLVQVELGLVGKLYRAQLIGATCSQR